MKKILFTFVLCVLMQGCMTSSTLKLDPQPLAGQKKVSENGVNAVVSGKKVRVTVRPLTNTYSSKERPTLVVSVYSTEKPFNFTTGNIQVFVDGNPHRVLTYKELAADIKNHEKKEIARVKGLKAQQFVTPGGGPMAPNNVTSQWDVQIASIKSNAQRSLKDLDSNILKSIRVLPNEQYSRHIVIEKIPNPSQSHKIKVIVTVAGEKHEFLINQAKI